MHDTTTRRVRDPPIMGHDTWLVLPRRRLTCPQCGPTVEAVPWLDRYQRMAKRLADLIAGFAQVLPNKQVAAIFKVSWDTVKQIDLRAMRTRLGPIDAPWEHLRLLTIDEFAIERGHRYATVVVAGPGRVRDQRRVIKGTRWLLLRSADTLAREERIRLRDHHVARRTHAARLVSQHAGDDRLYRRARMRRLSRQTFRRARPPANRCRSARRSPGRQSPARAICIAASLTRGLSE